VPLFTRHIINPEGANHMARPKKTSPSTDLVKAEPPKTRAKQSTGHGVKLPEIKWQKFAVWIVGDTPLITHAWSEKAKQNMLGKQQKEASEGLAARDPDADFYASLYPMSPSEDNLPFDERSFGFPVTAIKKALLSVAHKDRGVPRATVMSSLWLHADLVHVMPALVGATCDMPLVKIYGSKPQMREDMVRVGSGLTKKATLAYRAQFSTWAIRVKGRLNVSTCPFEWIPFLIRHSGLAVGIGDWRNEKNGMFGAYHIANPAEYAEWEAYRRGDSQLPTPVPFGGEFNFDDDDDDDFEEAAE
jgi:hypothetical protein